MHSEIKLRCLTDARLKITAVCSRPYFFTMKTSLILAPTPDKMSKNESLILNIKHFYDFNGILNMLGPPGPPPPPPPPGPPGLPGAPPPPGELFK